MNHESDYPSSIPVDCSCSEALASIQQSLDARGLRALRTFDLQDARLGDRGCACPDHDTSACDCQMQVFMVYGEAEAPATLMLHGHDGQTWVSLVDGSSGLAEGLIVGAIGEAIQRMQARQGL